MTAVITGAVHAYVTPGRSPGRVAEMMLALQRGKPETQGPKDWLEGCG